MKTIKASELIDRYFLAGNQDIKIVECDNDFKQFKYIECEYDIDTNEYIVTDDRKRIATDIDVRKYLKDETGLNYTIEY